MTARPCHALLAANCILLSPVLWLSNNRKMLRQAPSVGKCRRPWGDENREPERWLSFADCRLLTIYTRHRTIASMPRHSPNLPPARRKSAAVRAPAEARTVSKPEAAHTIALVQSNSLPNLVQQELERMILTGELPAGAKLTEAALAERLGVSRGPVREAFRALEEVGLVRLEKNRGVFVRQITIE